MNHAAEVETSGVQCAVTDAILMLNVGCSEKSFQTVSCLLVKPQMSHFLFLHVLNTKCMTMQRVSEEDFELFKGNFDGAYGL